MAFKWAGEVSFLKQCPTSSCLSFSNVISQHFMHHNHSCFHSYPVEGTWSCVTILSAICYYNTVTCCGVRFASYITLATEVFVLDSSISSMCQSLACYWASSLLCSRRSGKTANWHTDLKPRLRLNLFSFLFFSVTMPRFSVHWRAAGLWTRALLKVRIPMSQNSEKESFSI